jgi:hypothetical protein
LAEALHFRGCYPTGKTPAILVAQAWLRAYSQSAKPSQHLFEAVPAEPGGNGKTTGGS